MSLGGEYSLSITRMVAKLASSGIVVTVAAGNSHDDACKSSPANSKEVGMPSVEIALY